MDIREQKSFFIGDWCVTPDQDVVSRDGGIERLEPLAMQVLVYLASRAGEVVPRSELEEAVWKGAVVSYDSITSTVIKLRKALGDSARNPTYIATIPKRGYQLIAEVREDVQPAMRPAGDDPGFAAGSDKSGGKGWVRPVAVALLALSVVALTYLFIGDGPQINPPNRATPAIIVLPFENLGESPESDAFADGMTEDIITDLSGIAGIRVLASNTSFSYKGKQPLPQQIREELNVDYLLEGSIRRQGDSLRINAQLVDTRSAFQVWAERFDRRTEQTFALQDELTGQIVESLSVTLSPQEERRLAHQATNNLLAYDHFQEAQRLSRISTRETNQEAQIVYRKAIEADPGYGRAYGALAYNLSFSYLYGWNDRPMETIDRALELAQRGVQLDPSIPQTYWSLGYVHLVRREFEKAKAAVHNALQIAPNYADGYGLLALIQNNMDDAESAIANIRKGMALNPHYTWDYPYNLGRAYYILGQYDKAVELLEAAKTRNPNALPIRRMLAASYVRTGRIDDAEWEVEEIQTLSTQETLSHLKNTRISNHTESFRRVLDDLRQAGLPE